MRTVNIVIILLVCLGLACTQTHPQPQHNKPHYVPNYLTPS